MLSRLLSQLSYVEGDTKPDVLLSVEKSFSNPAGLAVTFSAYDAYTGVVELDHLASTLEDETSELDPCTNEILYSFKLRHVLTGALPFGIWNCNFSLDSTWHVPIAFGIRVVRHGS